MLTIKCAACKNKLFKYLKIGKGRVLYCWHDRICENYSIRNGNEVHCPCGNLIGIEEGNRIKMKQNSFTCSGTRTRG